jgi:diacylglycerol O-acyltransferase
MVNPRHLDRLTAQDLFMLWADDFGWSEDIGVLAIVDGTGLLDGDGRVRIEAVRRVVASRLHLVPHLRQLLYRPPRGLGWPLWVDAPAFRIADHVRVHPLTAPGEESELLAACAQLCRHRLDPCRPLWQAWLLPGMPANQVGLFLHVHHTIADGVAGMAALMALLDPPADTPVLEVTPWTPIPIPSAGQLLADNLRRRLRGLGQSLQKLVHPSRTLRGSFSVGREFFADRSPRTSLNRPIGADRRLAIVRSRLEVARQIAHAHHATVNDVVLAAVSGGLRELLTSRGEDVHGLVLRAMVPISLHHEQAGRASGNQTSTMPVSLPVGEPDPIRRLGLIAADTAARRGKTRPAIGSGLMRFVAMQRAFYRFLAHQRTVNLSVTNVPGPPEQLFLAGARVRELFPVVSLMGNVTLAVAVFSYAGQLSLTAVADQGTCPDVDVFAQGVRNALAELMRSMLVPVS